MWEICGNGKRRTMRIFTVDIVFIWTVVKTHRIDTMVTYTGANFIIIQYRHSFIDIAVPNNHSKNSNG